MSMSEGTPFRQTGILSRQITRRVVVLSLITILALIAVVVVGLTSSLQRTERQLGDAGSATARTIDSLLSEIKSDLATTGDSLALVESTQDVEETLRRMLDRQPVIFELLLVDPRGQVLAQRRRVGLGEPTVTEQPWLATVEIGTTYVGPVDYEKYNLPFVDIAAPVVDGEGYFAASLVAVVDLGSLWEEITRRPVGLTGYVFVTDERGQLLAYRSLELVREGRTLGESPADIAEAGLRYYTEFGGQSVVASAIRLTTVPWYVIVEQPVSEAMLLFALLATALMGLLVVVGILVYNIINFTAQRIAAPLAVLREGVDVLRQGNLAHRIEIQTRDELGDLASTFNTMAAQLQEVVGTLEQRVAERTRSLEAAAEVSRATTSELDPGQLLGRVVDLVRARFDLYYVGLFLVEEERETGREFAVLRAGTGEAGRQMMAQGHRLEVGGDSMIGQCVAIAEARIALDVGEEAVRFENPFLPETRSEMALPLRSRGRVVGAMTVQSVEGAAFERADIAVMQTMADQVAVAIDNARLFAETRTSLAGMEAAQRRYLGQAWSEYTTRRGVSGYKRTPSGIQPLDSVTASEAQRVVAERKPVVVGGGQRRGEGSSLVIPIVLRNQPVGALGLKDQEGKRSWSDEDVALVQEVAQQLALAADNLRLLDETQRRAARERLTSEVTARMRETLDIETVLQTAIREIGDTLDVAEVEVRLGSGAAMRSTAQLAKGSEQE